MKVVFANISGGLIFGGETYGELMFQRVDLTAYIEFFKQLNPDILALSEVHLESPDGSSEMVDRISGEFGLDYSRSQFMHPSHLDTSKQMGTAILSRYPIVDSESFKLESPKIEVDRPNGAHWVMHDKSAQKARLDTPDGLVDVANLSYFPFHHFNRRMDEQEFSPWRQRLVDFLLAGSNPTIITGDFNNKNVLLEDGFPELFAGGFKEGIVTPTTVVGYADQQLDHILYQTAHFTANDGFVAENGSDHYAIGATLQAQRPQP